MDEIISKIRAAESLTDKKFKKWQEENKGLISELLIEICKKDNDLSYQINESVINHESIILSYKKRPSRFRYKEDDLCNKQENLKGEIFENGGYLVFSVTIMGNISAWMNLPEIEVIMRNHQEHVDLGFIEQEKLSEEWINEMLRKFFETILNWKRGKLFDREPIGFKK